MNRSAWAGALVAALLMTGCGDDGGDESGSATGTAPPGRCLQPDPSIEAAARAHVRNVTLGPLAGFDADRLEVAICRTGDAQANATVTIVGVHDDSVRDIRHALTLAPERGFWLINGDVETRRCRPGRGQQEFAADPCV